MNLDTLEATDGLSGIDGGGREELATNWREMSEFVEEIERNYSLEEIPATCWETYIEYCAALGQPVSDRDLLRKKHPELYPEEIDFMLSPPQGGDCPF
jgi:hypothetical protein